MSQIGPFERPNRGASFTTATNRFDKRCTGGRIYSCADIQMRCFVSWVALSFASALSIPSSPAHEIYTGVHGHDGALCCGGSDCAPTRYRITRSGAEFFVHGREWVFIPSERITYSRLPGDLTGAGHFCGRRKLDSDIGVLVKNVFGNWYLYCAFIAPGDS